MPHGEIDRAVADGRTAGFTRLVLDRKGRIVGATVVGPRAGETLGELVVQRHPRLRSARRSRLLERRESATDRRNLVLALTDAGSELVDSLVTRRRKAVAAVLEQVPDSRRWGLATAMRAIAQGAGEALASSAWQLGWPTQLEATDG